MSGEIGRRAIEAEVEASEVAGAIRAEAAL